MLAQEIKLAIEKKLRDSDILSCRLNYTEQKSLAEILNLTNDPEQQISEQTTKALMNFLSRGKTGFDGYFNSPEEIANTFYNWLLSVFCIDSLAQRYWSKDLRVKPIGCSVDNNLFRQYTSLLFFNIKLKYVIENVDRSETTIDKKIPYAIVEIKTRLNVKNLEDIKKQSAIMSVNWLIDRSDETSSIGNKASVITLNDLTKNLVATLNNLKLI